MSKGNFWHAVRGGFIASHVITMTGFWHGGAGLSKLDVLGILAENMARLRLV
ncbi:MAG: hypothetical protein ACE5G5_04885 [Candidatus Methylomirabilales bacterium]